MYLTDKYGWPLEKRKGRPIHNFIRACALMLRGKLWLKLGRYDPNNQRSTKEELKNRVGLIEAEINKMGDDQFTEMMQEVSMNMTEDIEREKFIRSGDIDIIPKEND